jgi:hypothetical protein
MAASQHTHVPIEAIPPISTVVPSTAVDLSVPPAIGLLIISLSFLAGFATGITFELVNLRLRERRLAKGRRLLAAQARGVRQQLVDFYRLRDGALPSQANPTHIRHEGHES